MRISSHAKERLKSRFGLNKKDIQIVGCNLSTPGQYKTVKMETGYKEIREIIYIKNEIKHKIQFIILGSSAVTVIPKTHIQNEELKKLDIVTIAFSELDSIKIEYMKLLTMPWTKAINFLLKLRNNKSRHFHVREKY